MKSASGVVVDSGAVGGKVARWKQHSQQVYVKVGGQVGGLFELCKDAPSGVGLPGLFDGEYNGCTVRRKVGF
jgi:hypothetical protein